MIKKAITLFPVLILGLMIASRERRNILRMPRQSYLIEKLQLNRNS